MLMKKKVGFDDDCLSPRHLVGLFEGPLRLSQHRDRQMHNPKSVQTQRHVLLHGMRVGTREVDALYAGWEVGPGEARGEERGGGGRSE